MSFQLEREELWCVCAIIPQELDFPCSQPTASSETLPEVGKSEGPQQPGVVKSVWLPPLSALSENVEL